ncbi:hypothetical protein CONPUDRAFT_154725 [Coniophora puteana RWD-64-598 SS2]|uniref:Uncharacterized protein n=1 Tax=Coniophora puteana (strain RWD-64-598) TaxID=741705 RepID=A0A5M3MNH6_CONPW|nr:uncharacterized protein CONPUDRAFT_154725 [Coniophora puteana RWD-64-598 SS2]EIW80718.1 hypothetical protein CONPUDRAFT_154725 [Coniophora puteana RWD-64-598 SS2]
MSPERPCLLCTSATVSPNTYLNIRTTHDLHIRGRPCTKPRSDSAATPRSRPPSPPTFGQPQGHCRYYAPAQRPPDIRIHLGHNPHRPSYLVGTTLPCSSGHEYLTLIERDGQTDDLATPSIQLWLTPAHARSPRTLLSPLPRRPPALRITYTRSSPYGDTTSPGTKPIISPSPGTHPPPSSPMNILTARSWSRHHYPTYGDVSAYATQSHTTTLAADRLTSSTGSTLAADAVPTSPIDDDLIAAKKARSSTLEGENVAVSTPSLCPMIVPNTLPVQPASGVARTTATIRPLRGARRAQPAPEAIVNGVVLSITDNVADSANRFAPLLALGEGDPTNLDLPTPAAPPSSPELALAHTTHPDVHATPAIVYLGTSVVSPARPTHLLSSAANAATGHPLAVQVKEEPLPDHSMSKRPFTAAGILVDSPMMNISDATSPGPEDYHILEGDEVEPPLTHMAPGGTIYTSEPPEGWAITYLGYLPSHGQDVDQVKVWDGLHGNKVWFYTSNPRYEENATRTVALSRQAVAGRLGMVGKEVMIGVPTPATNTPSNGRHPFPHCYMLNLPRKWMIQVLLCQRVLCTKEITLFFVPWTPRRPGYLGTVEGFALGADPDEVSSALAEIKFFLRANQEAAVYLEEHMHLPDPQAYTRVVDSITITAVRIFGEGGKPLVVFNVICHDLPDLSVLDFQGWTSIIRTTVFTSTFFGRGSFRTGTRQFICTFCRSFDHPTGLCPFPLAPGWLGPQRAQDSAAATGMFISAGPSAPAPASTATKTGNARTGNGKGRGGKGRNRRL